MAKRKKLTVAQELEKAATLLQRYIRMKASDDSGYCHCVSCGRAGHYKTMDAGHYHSRRHIRLKCFEENIHVQCKRCNMLMGDPIVHDAYRQHMIDMYGERRLKAMKKLTYLPPKKFYRDEIIQFQREIKEKIGQQLYRLGDN